MSLASLSTELDEPIIRQLPQSDLHSISLTSKYYRALAEPHLYKDIRMCVQDNSGILWFFLTLLDRKELVQHIQTFTLASKDEVKMVNDDYVSGTYTQLYGNAVKIHGLIQQFAAPFRSTQFTRK
jgi:hypothetical protein